MADFDNPTFKPDHWEENIHNNNVISTSLHVPHIDGMSPSDGAAVQTSETSSLQQKLLQATHQKLLQTAHQELLQNALEGYYNKLQQQGLTPNAIDSSKFELVDGWLWLKAYPNLDLIERRTGSLLALSTVGSQADGGKVICEDLGFIDWMRKNLACPQRPLNP